MGPQLYIQERVLEEYYREMPRKVERSRMAIELPRRGSRGRHAIARLGTLLVAVGMWLKRVEQHEANLSPSDVAHSL
jgi:hypothetical protein